MAEVVSELLDESSALEQHKPNFVSDHREFMGRENELDEILAKLSADKKVLIVGMGGSGKSRIVERVGEIFNEEGNDVWRFDFSGIESFEGIVSLISAQFNLKVNSADAIRQLSSIINRDNALFIWESVESCHGQRFLEGLLANTPSSSHLLSSRKTLDFLNQDQVYNLRGLDLNDAVNLFKARCMVSCADTLSDVRKIEEIVELVDRIPLAIELIASRTKFFGPEELYRRLVARNDNLKGVHKNLDAVIESSAAMLSEEGRKALSQLCVFHGGASFDALCAVIGDGDWPEDLIDELLSLCFIDWEVHSTRRFVIPNGTFQWARRFVDEKTRLEARKKHARHFALVAEEHFQDGAQPKLLIPDLANIRDALEFSLNEENEEDVVSIFRVYWNIIDSFGPVSCLSTLVPRIRKLCSHNAEGLLLSSFASERSSQMQ